MGDLSAVRAPVPMLQYRSDCGPRVHFAVEPSRRAVATWHVAEPAGCVEQRVIYRDGDVTPWLPLGSWNGECRTSHSAGAGALTVAVDELRAAAPFVAVELRATGAFAAVALASSPRAYGASTAASQPVAGALALAVPPRTQYDAPPADMPPEVAASRRGWCSPASLAMLLAYRGRDRATAAVAAAVYDRAYAGTGNWSFNANYAARDGFGAVAYLRDLAHAHRFIAAGVPLALSFAWTPGTLPGAPLPASSGHVAVLRGFTAAGDPAFADPAQPALAATYPYLAFEAAWLGHGGVAYLVGARSEAARLLALAAGHAAP